MPFVFCGRVGIRTPNLLIRSQMLYPIELRNQFSLNHSAKSGCKYSEPCNNYKKKENYFSRVTDKLRVFNFLYITFNTLSLPIFTSHLPTKWVTQAACSACSGSW